MWDYATLAAQQCRGYTEFLKPSESLVAHPVFTPSIRLNAQFFLFTDLQDPVNHQGEGNFPFLKRLGFVVNLVRRGPTFLFRILSSMTG